MRLSRTVWRTALGVAAGGGLLATLAASQPGTRGTVASFDPHRESVERHRATRSADARSASTALRDEYGPYASEVLDQRPVIEARGAGFEMTNDELAAEATVDPVARRRDVRMRLPSEGREPLAFDFGDHQILVEEIGVDGRGEQVEGAVSYGREGGRVYWTEAGGGYEEWLDIEAGRAYAGRPLAGWRVSGATPREHGGQVLLADASGVPRMQVSAPRAWARSGRAVDATLSVVGNDIWLEVDAGGEAVLVDPMWSATSSLATARNDHSTTVLADGRVLVAGGRNQSGILASAEVYNPATNTWTPTGPMGTTRRLHASTLLADGRVLVAGGHNGANMASVEIYDPTSNTWSAAADMPVAAHWRVATTLADGTVLVTGGDITGATPALATAHRYDPATNTWTTAAPMNFQRRHHRQLRLADGRVLVVSGAGTAPNGIPSAEIYDPASNSWTETAPMNEGHRQPALVQLADGSVLAIGGIDSTGAVTTAAERYDVAADTWTSIAPLPSPRAFSTALLLQNGRVFVVGGDQTTADTVVSLTETALWDQATDTWSVGLPTTSLHGGVHTAALLPDGRVLVAAGNTVIIRTEPVSVAEIYTAVDPDGSSCSSSADCESGFCVDGVCCDTACGGGAPDCQACSVVAGAAVDGTCGPVSDGFACDDGNACTSGDSCAEAVCSGEVIAGACPCAAGTYSPDGSEVTGCMDCEDGTFSMEGATECTAWTECEDGEYESAAPSATADRQCTTCTVCGAGTTQTAACTETEDTVCTPVGEDAGPGTDAGPRTDAGPATSDGGTFDAGGTPPASGGEDGCSCVAVGAGRGASSMGALAALAALALVITRRRRRS